MRTPLLIALAVLAGCDFTPTLDVPLPEHAPALTFNGILMADSTVHVRVTASADPYGAYQNEGVFPVPEGARADLYRDGALVAALALEDRTCLDFSVYRPGEEYPTYPCGTFVSDAVIQAGATYTVRATAPGFPEATATVTVPKRSEISVVAGARQPGGDALRRDLTVTFRDPVGLGHRYALTAVSGPWTSTDSYSYCVDATCAVERDTTVTYRYDRSTLSYTTADPVLLAGARVLPAGGESFITFPDNLFDGTTRSFEIQTRSLTRRDREDPVEPAAVEVTSLDPLTYQAYQISWFSLGDDNPFQEPVRLPSNVTGGYGLLGAATVHEALLP